jgi:hypothetical protein
MNEEYFRKKQRQTNLIRSILDYIMGITIIVAGVFFFFRERWDLALNDSYPPNEWDKVFGGICFLYGAWRIYRGYKKQRLA